MLVASTDLNHIDFFGELGLQKEIKIGLLLLRLPETQQMNAT